MSLVSEWIASPIFRLVLSRSDMRALLDSHWRYHGGLWRVKGSDVWRCVRGTYVCSPYIHGGCMYISAGVWQKLQMPP